MINEYLYSSYNFTKEQTVKGSINEDGEYVIWTKNNKELDINQLTIHIANGSNLFATIVDQNGTLHDYGKRLQKMLETENKMAFQQISDGVLF